MGCCDFSINNPQNICLITWHLTRYVIFWVKYSIKKIGWVLGFYTLVGLGLSNLPTLLQMRLTTSHTMLNITLFINRKLYEVKSGRVWGPILVHNYIDEHRNTLKVDKNFKVFVPPTIYSLHKSESHKVQSLIRLTCTTF